MRRRASSHPFPCVSQRIPGVALWLHSQDRHAKGMAAYRSSPLTHYRQIKGMPKIIPLSYPSLPESLGRKEACLADVTGTIHLKFQHWLYPILHLLWGIKHELQFLLYIWNTKITWLSTLVLEVVSTIGILFLTKVIDPSPIHPVMDGDPSFFTNSKIFSLSHL